MRGPVDVKKIFRSSSWGDRTRGACPGGLPLLWGGAAARRRGGNPPAPTSPWGERERGIHDSFLAAAGSLRCSALASSISFPHRRLALLPFALSCGAFCSGASWCPSSLKRVLLSPISNSALFPESDRSAGSAQSPERGDLR